ncbi:Sir2 family NAD-dependent protein deacetylase [Microbacterium invictum]|uniref:NAD-dependent protein deacylase n=1 Tax=Microbacterium invictum TaxID=515415 RepID=A0AA40VME6_9MICO|nr:NAD-dependent deacylase [Microbacterium invictum]MBB4139742.1 NAD-dependent deacetylase [Microbacterium invictum]
MSPRIVVVTGAGISAESGLATFRDADGLWNEHRVEDVASPEGFERDPDLVHAFYDRRRREAASARPNAAHIALAELERQLPATDGRDGVVIVTQNVDDLHERAGSRHVIHMHGELASALCAACDQRHEWHEGLAGRPPCPACGVRALRPDVVWFGEPIYRFEEIELAVSTCESLVVIGTSGTVWPAAGLARLARERGARTMLVNLDAYDDHADFDEVRLGHATVAVPQLVRELLDADAAGPLAT